MGALSGGLPHFITHATTEISINTIAPELTIVLPSYQEGANLAELLPQLSRVAQILTDKFEILVVDTRTPLDDTPDVCRQNQATYLPRCGGDMYGDAVRTGIEASRGRYVALMDADGSHNPTFLPKLWEYRSEADLVIASRYVKGGHTENPAILVMMSLLVNVVFRRVLGLKCLDVSNSFRLYKGDDLRLLKLQCFHFDIVEEILVTLSVLRPSYRIHEVPFSFEQRKAGKTKRKLLAFVFSYLFVLWKLYRLKCKARSQSFSK